MEVFAHVKDIIFRNEKTGYTVVKFVQNYEYFIAVGFMPDVTKDCDYTFEGEWETDPMYGEQFHVKSYIEDIPRTKDEMAIFISNVIPDITPMMGCRLLSLFGTDIFYILESQPESLVYAGYDNDTAQKIHNRWIEYKGIKEIRLFLQEHEINTIYATRIYDVFRNDSVRMLKNNPYCILDNVYGITFKTADSIAKKLGIKHTAMTRIKSGILHVMKKYSSVGHCFTTRVELTNESAKLLDIDTRMIDNTIQYLIEFHFLIEDNGIYLSDIYNAERFVAKRLNEIKDTKVETIHGFIMEGYEAKQRQAIEYSMFYKIMILTGGPGTGKTTTVSGIIRAFKDKKVILAAPTGRAAKRMEEMTNMPAETLHRLLDAKKDGSFGRNENFPIEGDLLIVDECSMIDINLMCHLLKAIPNTMRIIFVGDSDQLPSIGPGNVFSDMIRSGSLPVVTLTTIFRQKQGLIKRNANRIKHGKPLVFNDDDSCIFCDVDKLAQLIKTKDPEIKPDPEILCGNAVELLIKKYLPKHFTFQDIQILSPMKKGNVGTYALNERFRRKTNKSIELNDKIFYLRDKVMQTRNNYDKDVYNGDIGYICFINEVDETVYVDFGDRVTEYKKRELEQLQPAYAITIHKSQGNEYPVVILILMPGHNIMLERNLFYTGVTRAKEKLIIVGTKEAIAKAIQTQRSTQRNTTLCDRIREYDFTVQKKNIC